MNVARRGLRLLLSAVRLRCPRCGRAALFQGVFAMHSSCPVCRLVFEREPGYFVGAIYVNYAATVVTLGVASVALEWLVAPPLGWQLAVCGAIALAFPLAFFRHARSLWLGIDHLVNPQRSDCPDERRILRRVS
jgi:uncharacterized protein (DUF983 family)